MLDTVVKVVLVFLIVVVSISIVSEYICLKTIRLQTGQSKQLSKEEKIDAFLANLKQTLMERENFETYKPIQKEECKKVEPKKNEIQEDIVLNQDYTTLQTQEVQEFPTQSVPELLQVPTVIRKNIGNILPAFDTNTFLFAEVNF